MRRLIANHQTAIHQTVTCQIENSAMASLLAAESRSHWIGFDFDSMGCFQIANCFGPNCFGPNYSGPSCSGLSCFGRCFRWVDHLGYLASSRNSIGYLRTGFVDRLD